MEEAFCPKEYGSLMLNNRDQKFDGKELHYTEMLFFCLSKEFSLNLGSLSLKKEKKKINMQRHQVECMSEKHCPATAQHSCCCHSRGRVLGYFSHFFLY